MTPSVAQPAITTPDTPVAPVAAPTIEAGASRASGGSSAESVLRAAPVLIVGPRPDQPGGMASVVGHCLSAGLTDNRGPAFFPITVSLNPRERLPGKLRRHVAQSWRLVRRIRSDGIRIAHFHTCSGFSFYRTMVDLMVARRLGCATVLHIHGAMFDRFFENAGVLGRHGIRRGLRRADCVIALSRDWARRLTTMSPNARIEIVENIADPVSVPNRVRPTVSPTPGLCRFVLLAKMDVWKGIDDLLDAARLLQADGVDFELTLAGPEGSAGDARTIADKIARRGIARQVRYVGTVHGDDKHRLLKSADAYVQPSHHEGMPISVLEALAHALPVIATTVGSLPEVIDDGRQGLLVPPHEPTSLAVAMRRLAMSVQLRRELSAQALQLAQTRFSPERFRNDLRRVYLTALNPTKPDPRPTEP